MAAPGLDLDEDQGLAVHHHQVQLAKRRPDIPLNDLVAEATEVVLGERLAANSERIDWQRQLLPARRGCG